MTILAGAYTGTWNALACGNTLSGYELSYATRGRPISSDAVGQTVLDYIYAGTNMMVSAVLQEYDAAAIATMLWWQSGVRGVSKTAGQSMWAAAKPLILTSCLAGVTPATITFPKALLAPDYDIQYAFSSRERFIPFRWIILPVKVTLASPSVANFADPVAMPTGCNDYGFFIET